MHLCFCLRFFVVEDHILNTTSGLVTRATIDELWDMAVAKIVAILKSHIACCTDPTLMLQIKALIMLFCHTLKVNNTPLNLCYL